MKKEILFTIDAPYRQNLAVNGWRFGNPNEKTLAVMGALRGNEVQQMFICSQLVKELTRLESEGAFEQNTGILVIPCANQFSMNVGRRFWAADNTDINRMFPGYNLGETTQRIADAIFRCLQGYQYGIHVTSFYLPGNFVPHVRLMETGFDHPEAALDFGLPYIVVRKPQPYDTTTLNYNWQIWDTTTFSLYTCETDLVDEAAAASAVQAILRFLKAKGVLKCEPDAGVKTRIFREDSLQDVLSREAGVLLHRTEPGTLVSAGEKIAEICDPCTAEVREELHAPCSGRIFFAHRAHLINGHDIAFRLLPEEEPGEGR